MTYIKKTCCTDFQKNGANRPNICFNIKVLLVHYLRSLVVQRAMSQSRACFQILHNNARSEITNTQLTPIINRSHEQITWLQVPVNYAILMEQIHSIDHWAQPAFYMLFKKHPVRLQSYQRFKEEKKKKVFFTSIGIMCCRKRLLFKWLDRFPSSKKSTT